jgi:lipoate-protein ligase A
MPNWFLLFDKTPLSASENMARDEYLFNICHKKKMGFFRLYSWDIPSFSFGVSQKITRAVDVDFVKKNDCAYVRRITGGKTVLHNHEITYSVVSSEAIFYKENDLYRSYMLISKVLVDALRALGMDAYLSGGVPDHLSLAKSSNPCFSFPTPNEIEIGGKKIVGSAQKRDNKALLQHGSIPLSMNYELYAGGTGSRPGIIARSMTTLNDVSDKKPDDLCRSLIESFENFIGQPLKEFEFDNSQKQAAAEIEKKYRSHDWNHRL